MGRLENIIARNQRPNRPRERLVVSLSFGAIVLLILALMLFTDLGLPPELLRGFALLARTAGLLGQLAEERRHPVGMDIYLTVERGAESVPPDPAPTPEP